MLEGGEVDGQETKSGIEVTIKCFIGEVDIVEEECDF